MNDQPPPIGLKAQMTLDEILAAAKSSERYFVDMDVHLLTDHLEQVWAEVKHLQAAGLDPEW
jgi:hypothetical protein